MITSKEFIALLFEHASSNLAVVKRSPNSVFFYPPEISTFFYQLGPWFSMPIDSTSSKGHGKFNHFLTVAVTVLYYSFRKCLHQNSSYGEVIPREEIFLQCKSDQCCVYRKIYYHICQKDNQQSQTFTKDFETSSAAHNSSSFFRS